MENRFLKCKKKTPRDQEYVNAYLKTHSQTKAADICGVSRETIARAVRRAEIVLDGRKLNNGQKNGQLKISNEQISYMSKELTPREISNKFDMHPATVEKRCRRLKLEKKQGVGYSKGHYSSRSDKLTTDCYDKKIDLYEVYKKFEGRCQICGEMTDTNDRTDKKVGNNYPSVDHIIPISKGGTHTWDNVQLAHIICNSKKGNSITVKREGVWT